MVSTESGNELQEGVVSDPGTGAEPKIEAAQFCARCGAGLAGDARFCKACGRPVVQPAAAPPPVYAYTTPAVKRFCGTCAAEVHPLAEICPKCGVRLARPITGNPADVSPKSRLTATLLCALLGALLCIFGIHRLYLGKTGTGVTQLVLGILGWLTIWMYGLGLLFWAAGGIWQIVDFILLLSGSMKDGNGQTVIRWTDAG